MFYLSHRTHITPELKVPMKRKFLFDIFIDKGFKFRFLLLKLNIAPFNNSKISVKHDKSYATKHPRGRKCVHNIACDVNTFAKFKLVSCPLQIVA